MFVLQQNFKKCGVYKYVEAPDFAVLLFAYSADNGPVANYIALSQAINQ